MLAMTMQAREATAFQALHQRRGAFILPNAWDISSARLLEGLGFEAIATTSSGFAASLGRDDGEATFEEVLTHCRALCEATHLPVSADLENGYAHDPAAAAANLVRAAHTGLAGGSIEDYTGDAASPIYDFNLAVERVRAAVEAVHGLGFPFTLTARAENLLRGRRDLDDTIRRLQAYEAAGADVLYAPALSTLEEVRLVTTAVKKPVNVLAPPVRRASVAELAEAGVKRISLGGALSRLALTAVVSAGKEMLDRGTFTWSDHLISSADLTALLRR